MSVNHGANLYDLSSKYGFSKDEFMDFSSNINPFGTSNKAKEYVINNINMVSMYPDPEYVNLKKSISTYCHCLEENIVLGSGATELISSFIKTIKPNKTLLLSPAYSEYEKELNKINSEVVKYFSKEENNFVIDEKELVNSINERNYDLTIICNPNNPTGFAFSREQVEYILKNTTCYVMIDETYIEFTETNIYSSTKLVDDYNKLFVIRGTSKFFSTPGIRLGYGLIGDKNIKEAINKNLDLWNINIIASAMGEIMFLDDMFISNTIDAMLRERDYLTTALSSIDDLTVYPSKGNFILCKINSKKLTAGELREKLLPKKIIIRDCNSFDGLTEYYFRVCILKPEENRLLIKNLNSIFK
ncbi:pyridoxal phosphate-dependent aminotransferase [Intestinibacter sp.]|uniref:pyridoxal phosphate-dependent aminotransferase n=1 Tax=Intestinibacter sp. TaxID=1965304 RepID=UPI002A7479AB|nr:histidinol-phosphate transaminase [Intestinibacter sp.]MDY2736288.1 histidinol-phosphate transaminase [Intestinibacter sp.]MDY4574586.1 histidinol-phosphate transaminase [Intestinibacter sp.]